MTLTGTRRTPGASSPRRPEIPAIHRPPGVPAGASPLPQGSGVPSPRGLLPRLSGADPSGARDFTTTGRRNGSADH